MDIIIACDHAGLGFKQDLIRALEQLGHCCMDCGVYEATPMDYPDITAQLAQEVLKQGKLGIIICGTGIGVSISANKINGIRAALCYNEYMARMSRKHNDANVLALGSRVIGIDMACAIAATFLETDFEGGRHQVRVDKVSSLEQNLNNK